MQTQFLDTYQAINTGKLRHLTGLWLIHGDEPLVLSWFIDLVRPLFKVQAQTIVRISLDSPKHWAEVITALESLSLFAESSAVIVTGKQKCDDATLMRLSAFADAVANGNSSHCLIYQLPKQDKKSQATKLFKLFSERGHVVDCHVHDESQRAKLLATKASALNIALTPDAWQFLLSHTEYNLLAAYQALWRLCDLHVEANNTPLDIEALLPALVSDYQYSVFHLCDSLLSGDATKSLHILQHLKQVDTAPSIILWGIAKDMRLLCQLQAGKNFNELGIWRNKIPLYEAALRRGTTSTKHLNDLYEADKIIKGLNHDNIWRALSQICLAITTPKHPHSNKTSLLIHHNR